MSIGKDTIIYVIVGLMEKTFNEISRMQLHCIKTSQHFPKPFKNFVGSIYVKVDLSNYARKNNLKNIAHIETSSFALKTNLAGLKTEVDKLDIGK